MKSRLLTFSLVTLVGISPLVVFQPVRAVNRSIFAWSVVTVTAAAAATYALLKVRMNNGVRAECLTDRARKMLALSMIHNDAIALDGLKAEIVDYLGVDGAESVQTCVDERALSSGVFNYLDYALEASQFYHSDAFKVCKADVIRTAYRSSIAWARPSYAFLAGVYAELYLRSKIIAKRDTLKEKQNQKRWKSLRSQ